MGARQGQDVAREPQVMSGEEAAVSMRDVAERNVAAQLGLTVEQVQAAERAALHTTRGGMYAEVQAELYHLLAEEFGEGGRRTT